MLKLKTALTLSVLALTATQLPAAVVTRSILKSFFTPGAKPTSAQFNTLLDSALNYSDDHITLSGVGITPGSIGTPVLDAIRKTGVGGPHDRPYVNDLTTFGPESNHYDVIPLWAGNDGYLPLQFLDDANQPHYGFLDMQMAPYNGDPDASPIFVTSVSYELSANTPIALPDPVPEPTTLTLLALAAPLLLRRRVTSRA